MGMIDALEPHMKQKNQKPKNLEDTSEGKLLGLGMSKYYFNSTHKSSLNKDLVTLPLKCCQNSDLATLPLKYHSGSC